MAYESLIDIRVLRQLSPFAALSETHLHDMRRRIELHTYAKGKILFKRDEPDDRMYFLLQGCVDLADAKFDIVTITGGTEAALVELDKGNPHRFTAVCTTPVMIASLKRDRLDLALTWDQAGNYVVSELSAGDTHGVEADWMSYLVQSQLFARVPPSSIQKLFARFEAIEFKAGDYVVRQGDTAEYFYVLKSGNALITRRMQKEGESRDLVLAELNPGDVFGEDALIGDSARNANVVMASDGVLMRLGKEDFRSLLERPVLQFLSFEDMQNLRKSGANVCIIDVRLPMEYEQSHLPEAMNLPVPLLRERAGSLDNTAIYVTTCDGGRRCHLAAYLLSQRGLEAYALKDAPPLARTGTG